METLRYWLVGANWDGDDKAEVFYRRGYWELGWSDRRQPKMAFQRDSMQPSDRIALKSMCGYGSQNIIIKALGIVKEVGEDKRVYVKWIMTNLERKIPSRGCYKAIHGPYFVNNDEKWLGKIFLL